MSADIVIRPGIPGERPFEVLLDGTPITLDRTVRPGGGFIYAGERLFLHPVDWWSIAYPRDYARQLTAVRMAADADFVRRWALRSE